jgi:pyruvate dehydrogenase E2 component (dihydrolipoamide acetyltransferase)
LAISPSARRLARELGVDPASVQGTGHGGAITREDIERAAASKTPPQAPPLAREAAPRLDRSARIRQTIAAAMSRSKREIPHYYLSTTIDMHRALEWLGDQNAKRPVAERVLYGALLLKAVALALREVPELNATWQEGQVVLKNQIHVGVAVSLRQGGLVAPALHNTDQLTLDELMKRMRDLVNRTRAGSLRSSEMSDPTITVTNLGEQGVESVYAVIYPPQVAMVGVGKIVERPWCVDGRVVARRVVTVTLAADHRVSDGHRGGIFLAAVDRLLQEPQKL